MKELLDMVRKEQRRKKRKGVRLALIDASLYPPNSMAEIASQTRVEQWNRRLYIH